MSQVKTILDQELQSILNGSKTSKEVLNSADDCVNVFYVILKKAINKTYITIF